MQWDSPVFTDADKTGVTAVSENNPQTVTVTTWIEEQVGRCVVDIIL